MSSMKTAVTTAQELIRAAAEENGWVIDGRNQWMDRFVRPVDPATLPEVLARFFEVTDHVPTEMIVIHYDDLGRVRYVNTATPGQQSAITGDHVGVTEMKNTGRRAAVLRILAGGVPA